MEINIIAINYNLNPTTSKQFILLTQNQTIKLEIHQKGNCNLIYVQLVANL